jgi:hypothetical protein
MGNCPILNATETLTIPAKFSAVQKSKPTVPFFNPAQQIKKLSIVGRKRTAQLHNPAYAGAGDRMNPAFFF